MLYSSCQLWVSSACKDHRADILHNYYYEIQGGCGSLLFCLLCGGLLWPELDGSFPYCKAKITLDLWFAKAPWLMPRSKSSDLLLVCFETIQITCYELFIFILFNLCKYVLACWNVHHFISPKVDLPQSSNLKMQILKLHNFLIYFCPTQPCNQTLWGTEEHGAIM